MRLGKIMLYVNDQDEALKFWTEQVGFELKKDLELDSESRWIEVASVFDFVSLVLYSKKKLLEQYPNSCGCAPKIAFATEDLDRIYYHLQENGVQVTPIQQYPHGRLFSFMDNESVSYDVRETIDEIDIIVD